MAVQSTAGVEFSGSVMRYSEIEQVDSAFKLLRLGNCEFEFDASSAICAEGAADRIETIRRALQDIFQGTQASVIRFVLPSSGMSRFTSLVSSVASEAERKAQITFETSLLSGDVGFGDVFPEILDSRAEEGLEKYSVSYVTPLISENLKAVGAAFEDTTVELVPSTNAAFLAFRHFAQNSSLPGGAYLLIGVYSSLTDFILIKNGASQAHVSIRTPFPENVAYHALLLANRFGLTYADITHLYVYGEEPGPKIVPVLEEAFGEIVSVFNPVVIVNLEEDRFEAGFPIEAFVPSIGAAIQ